MTSSRVARKRLDIALVDRGLVDGRSRARAEVMSGNVYLNGNKCDKPGTPVSDDSKIELVSVRNPYVSRGGQKLSGAAEDLGFTIKGKTVLDIGASTGGFTHFALDNGALRVYAIDVGYGQLDWSLRKDERVISMERINARYLKKEDLPEIPQIAFIDVSFISLAKILPAIINEVGVREIVTLVKPQFEAGPGQVGKNGVVKDPIVYRQVMEQVISTGVKLGLKPIGAAASRLKGPKGNAEFFIHWIMEG